MSSEENDLEKSFTKVLFLLFPAGLLSPLLFIALGIRVSYSVYIGWGGTLVLLAGMVVIHRIKADQRTLR